MSSDNNNLPSYKDFLEKPDGDLPSIEELLEEKSLPSVNDFLSKPVEEEILVEETIEEPTPEVEDLTEVLRLINDVRRDIPDVPEIKYYDEELKDICERISQIQEAYTKGDSDLILQNEELESKLEDIESKIPTVKYYDHDISEIHDKIVGIKEEINNLPEVRYYEQDLDSLKSRIEQVNEAIPDYPDWIQKVQEVPDFSWIGKTFSLIDEDFNKVQGHLDLIREKIDYKVNELNDTFEKKEFELRVDHKNLTEHFEKNVEYVEETKDKLLQQIKDISTRIWENHNTSKDDDRKLRKSILSEQNKLKQSLQKEIESIDEKSVNADESILKFFTDLSNDVEKQFKALPEVKYYDDDVTRIDEDVTRIDEDILSLREELKELSRIANLIKVEQKNLQENYLLSEPPDQKQTAGFQTDPLTPEDQKFATLEDLSNHYRLFINRIQVQMATMGGGGAGFIKDLDDVNFDATDGDGQVLIWDSPNNRWVGIGSTELSGSIGIQSAGTLIRSDVKTLNFIGLGNTFKVNGDTVDISISPGAAGTWTTGSVGIHTTKNVGIGTTAVSDKALYVLGDGQFTGNLTVGGTITYEDVKNVDSVGFVTARSGIRIGTGGTVGPVGTGIVTYYGDGSKLTGIIGGVGIQSGSSIIGTGITDINFTGAGVSVVGSGTTVIVDIPATTIRRQVATSSGVTTEFTITDGYTSGFIDVFLNGVKQRNGTDFTATNETSVIMVPPVSDGDVLEFQIYENLTVASGGESYTGTIGQMLQHNGSKYVGVSSVGLATYFNDHHQGYYRYSTHYYSSGIANTVQTLPSDEFVLIQPSVRTNRVDYLPQKMLEANGNNPWVGTGATIGTGHTEFSLAGLDEGSTVIVRIASQFNPDIDYTNVDFSLNFTTNPTTQSFGTTYFSIVREQGLICNEGADQPYLSETLINFYVGNSLSGITTQTAGTFNMSVRASEGGEFEMLALTVNVVA